MLAGPAHLRQYPVSCSAYKKSFASKSIKRTLYLNNTLPGVIQKSMLLKEAIEMEETKDINVGICAAAALQLTSRIGDGRVFDAVSAQPPMMY